jgi:hypothetical protein
VAPTPPAEPVNPVAKPQLLLPDSLTPQKRQALLAYIEYGTVTAAMRVTGLSRQTWYDWKRDDEVFLATVADVEEAVADDLEQECIRRAKDGDTTLLIFLLKGKRPALYRDKVEHSADTKLLEAIVAVPRKAIA